MTTNKQVQDAADSMAKAVDVAIKEAASNPEAILSLSTLTEMVNARRQYGDIKIQRQLDLFYAKLKGYPKKPSSVLIPLKPHTGQR